MRLERHHPVHRSEGHRQAPQDQPRRAQRSQAVAQPRLPGAVLPRRPPVQKVGQRQPHREIKSRAPQEEGHVQVDDLVPQKFVGSHLFRIGPEVNVFQPDEHGHEQHQQQRQRPSAGFEQPPNHQPPFPSHQVVQHHQGQAAQRHAHPEQVAQQVRAEELRRRTKPPADTYGRSHQPHHQGPPLNAVEFRAGVRGLVHGSVSRSRWRSWGGASVSWACWLNCSART